MTASDEPAPCCAQSNMFQAVTESLTTETEGPSEVTAAARRPRANTALQEVVAALRTAMRSAAAEFVSANTAEDAGGEAAAAAACMAYGAGAVQPDCGLPTPRRWSSSMLRCTPTWTRPVRLSSRERGAGLRPYPARSQFHPQRTLRFASSCHAQRGA